MEIQSLEATIGYENEEELRTAGNVSAQKVLITRLRHLSTVPRLFSLRFFWDNYPLVIQRSYNFPNGK